MAFLRGMLNQLEDGPIRDVSDPDVRSVLFSKPAYESQPILQTLQDIAEERAELCYRLIDAQFALAEAGARRLKWLFEHYGFYVHDVLGGKESAAESDLHQQAIDVAVMYTLSHSRIVFARSFGNPDSQKHQYYEDKVRKQERHLHDLNKVREAQMQSRLALPNGAAPTNPLSQLETARNFQEIEVLTLDVGNKNMAIVRETKNLVENSIRSLYFWYKILEGAQPRQSMELKIMPEEDLTYERDLTALYLERMEILNTRGGLVYNLANSTAELQPDLPYEFRPTPK